jgi:hypothetical protein
MDHFKVLKRAFRITWNYRALWLIGLLLVLAGGGVWGSVSGPPGGSSSGNRGDDSPIEWHAEEEDLAKLWKKIAPIVTLVAIGSALFVLTILAIVILAAAVRCITRTSLIRMVQSYEQTGEKIGVKGSLRLGWSRSAFRLFLIDLILRLPLALLMLLLIGTLLTFAILSFVTESGPMIVLGILLVLLIVPVVLLGIFLGVILGAIAEIAYRACVIEKRGAWESIVKGISMIRRNLGATALQWVLLAGLGIAWRILRIPVTLLLGILALIIVGIPTLLAGGIATLLSGPWGLGVAALVFVPTFVLLILLPNLALTTLATVFHSTTWTLTYRELGAIDAEENTLDA